MNDRTNIGSLNRRTFFKGALATGATATALTTFGGAATAKPDISVSDDKENYDVKDSDITIEKGNKNAYFQEIDVEITDIDKEAGTASGIVSGTVLPNKNANENAAKDFEVDFEDADVTHLGDVGNPTELIRLEIPDLFLDILGLQISLDLELLVEADPDGGLLGRLLDALLG